MVPTWWKLYYNTYRTSRRLSATEDCWSSGVHMILLLYCNSRVTLDRHTQNASGHQWYSNFFPCIFCHVEHWDHCALHKTFTDNVPQPQTQQVKTIFFFFLSSLYSHYSYYHWFFFFLVFLTIVHTQFDNHSYNCSDTIILWTNSVCLRAYR